ncbi:MAG: Holliday junction resolvase RuvX [Gammaproteobacteria bacterium]
MPEPRALSALGFDFGLRSIGVATGQSVTGSAAPVTVLSAEDGRPDWNAVDRLIAQWQPDRLVVGLPYTMQGGEQELSQRARAFARELAARYPRPVHLVDERWSSREAESRLKALRQQGRKRVQRADIDCAAACIILESWLHDPH